MPHRLHKKGWTTLISILAPFLLLPHRFTKSWTTRLSIPVLLPFLPHRFTKSWTTCLPIPVSSLFLPRRLLSISCFILVLAPSLLKKAGQPAFPFLFHPCSCPITFTKRLDNLSFPFCSTPRRLHKKVGQPFFQFPVLFLLLSHRLHKKAGHPILTFLPYSHSCPVAFTKGWTTHLSIPALFVPLPLSPTHRLHTPEPYFCFPSNYPDYLLYDLLSCSISCPCPPPLIFLSWSPN